ncbi:anti-sigma-I factor RsgI family protein [Fictibacillus fluitans]|uniref:RsgI N-terminal anti-sigma domain-containing protein n=1 Tax=Fictibacillus fluitans TaxID=3058422 RepID=A0ABT8I1C2_9BACL|nr:hypothetical protein [Fictibacillus sp. NE201]MDN4526774.1 hypothetical protein [Fictibacillus sp. NE201]
MTKGIVVEVKRHHIIVLSEGGVFRKVKNNGQPYAVGSDILLPNEPQSRPLFSLPVFNWKSATVFTFAILLLFFQLAPNTGQGVYAYVGMEMNPSIELSIDDDMLVQHITAYNSDGKKLVALLEDYHGQPLEKVTGKIFKICRAKGFIKPDQEVIVTTTLTKDVSKETQQKIEQKINSLMEQKALENKIDMTSLIISNKERKRAKKSGLTPAKYAIFMAAKEAGIPITQTDIKKKSIQELSDTVGPISDLLSTTPLGEYKHVSVFVHNEPSRDGIAETSHPVYEDDPVLILRENSGIKSDKPTEMAVDQSAAKKDAECSMSKPIPAAPAAPAQPGPPVPANKSSNERNSKNQPVTLPVIDAVKAPAAEPAKTSAPAAEPVKQSAPVATPAPVQEKKTDKPAAPASQESKGSGTAVISIPRETDKEVKTSLPPVSVPKEEKASTPSSSVSKEETKPASAPEREESKNTDRPKAPSVEIEIKLPEKVEASVPSQNSKETAVEMNEPQKERTVPVSEKQKDTSLSEASEPDCGGVNQNQQEAAEAEPAPVQEDTRSAVGQINEELTASSASIDDAA